MNLAYALEAERVGRETLDDFLATLAPSRRNFEDWGESDEDLAALAAAQWGSDG